MQHVDNYLGKEFSQGKRVEVSPGFSLIINVGIQLPTLYPTWV